MSDATSPPRRFHDALAMHPDTHSPAALALHLHEACREVITEEDGRQREDPAIRLLGHHVAVSLNVHRNLDDEELSDLVKACEERNPADLPDALPPDWPDPSARGRNQDALFINEGASNPAGVSRALCQACREVEARGGNSHKDPATRLIANQLCFLLNVERILDTDDYDRIITACEAGRDALLASEGPAEELPSPSP